MRSSAPRRRSRTRCGPSSRGGRSPRSGTAATSRTLPGLNTTARIGSASPTPAASSAAVTRDRSSMRWHAPTGTSSRASSATSAARTASTLSSLRLGDRLELIPYLPRGDVLALQRDSDALLLLIPEAGGRGRGVLSGKVFEYLAAERPIIAAVPPDGEAAALLRVDRGRSGRRPGRRGWAGGRDRPSSRERGMPASSTVRASPTTIASGSRGAPGRRSSPALLRGLG